MSKVPYHKVESTIWTQPWDNDVRLLAFYLLTCEHRTTEGLYRLPMAYAANDLGWTPKKLSKAFAGLVAAGFVEYDDATSVVLVVNALKRSAPNPNQAKAAVKKLRVIPVTYLRARFYALAEAFAPLLVEALREAFGEGLGEWLGDPHNSTSNSSSPPSSPGLGTKVVGGWDASGDPGPLEPSNVTGIFDGKTGQEGWAA